MHKKSHYTIWSAKAGRLFPCLSRKFPPFHRNKQPMEEAYATDGIGKANAADEIDEDEVIREDLSLSDDPLPEVSPTAILSRDLARVNGWSRNDDALDEESPEDVRTTLQSLRGTDLMEKYKAYLAEQERDHRKLLAAIRRSEEAEVQTSEVVPTPIPDENTDDKPLSYYL